jgi:hypothetical protein
MKRTTIPLFLNSSTTTGAIVSSNGSRFEVILDPPVSLPDKSKKVSLSCALHSANIWYTFPNISAASGNNHFRFTIGATPYDYTLPDGLYDITAIESKISDLLTNDTLSPTLFKFDPDTATGTISFQINAVGVTVFWSDANSIGQLLGFTIDDGPTASSGLIYESDSQAQLNVVDDVLVNFSACSSHFNHFSGSSVIASITPNVVPGFLIDYTPNNLVECDVVGTHFDRVSVWLENSRDRSALDTFGETFSVVILMFYDEAVL